MLLYVNETIFFYTLYKHEYHGPFKDRGAGYKTLLNAFLLMIVWRSRSNHIKNLHFPFIFIPPVLLLATKSIYSSCVRAEQTPLKSTEIRPCCFEAQLVLVCSFHCRCFLIKQTHIETPRHWLDDTNENIYHIKKIIFRNHYFFLPTYL